MGIEEIEQNKDQNTRVPGGDEEESGVEALAAVVAHWGPLMGGRGSNKSPVPNKSPNWSPYRRTGTWN